MASALQDKIKRRIQDIQSHGLSAIKDSQTAQDLNESTANVKQDCLTVERELEELRLLAEDSPTEQERERALSDAQVLASSLAGARSSFRQVSLAAKRRIDSNASTSQRHDLLRGSTTAKAQQGVNDDASDDAIMTASADITNGLRRTLALMQQELDRSVLSNQMLEDSSNNLRMTGDQYTTFGTLINASKAIITSLEKADTIDRLLILAALIFFGLVCAWIIKRRVIDKGLRIVGFAGKLIPRIPLKRNVEDVPVSPAKVASSVVSVVSSATILAASVASSLKTSIAEVMPTVLPTSTIIEDIAESIEPIVREPLGLAHTSETPDELTETSTYIEENQVMERDFDSRAENLAESTRANEPTPTRPAHSENDGPLPTSDITPEPTLASSASSTETDGISHTVPEPTPTEEDILSLPTDEITETAPPSPAAPPTEEASDTEILPPETAEPPLPAASNDASTGFRVDDVQETEVLTRPDHIDVDLEDDEEVIGMMDGDGLFTGFSDIDLEGLDFGDFDDSDEFDDSGEYDHERSSTFDDRPVHDIEETLPPVEEEDNVVLNQPKVHPNAESEAEEQIDDFVNSDSDLSNLESEIELDDILESAFEKAMLPNFGNEASLSFSAAAPTTTLRDEL